MEKDQHKTKVNEAKKSGVITKYYGKRTFKDIETGELIELEYFDKAVKHTLQGGWRRVYLENFMELLTGLYSSQKKIELIEFILNNLNSDNQLILTQQQVIAKTGISTQTVVDTYKYLVEKDFMKKTGGVFTINPKFVCAFGSDKKNARILINYHDDDPALFD